MLLISLVMVTDGVNDPGDSIVLTTERLESGAVLQGKNWCKASQTISSI